MAAEAQVEPREEVCPVGGNSRLGNGETRCSEPGSAEAQW